MRVLGFTEFQSRTERVHHRLQKISSPPLTAENEGGGGGGGGPGWRTNRPQREEGVGCGGGVWMECKIEMMKRKTRGGGNAQLNSCSKEKWWRGSGINRHESQ